jgi:putative addiction module killer protein
MVDNSRGENYSWHVIELIKSATFGRWLGNLRDTAAKARIEARIRRLSLGNPGDVKPVGEGVSEMRIDHGPGYRVYFKRRGAWVAILLCGGDKSTQARDIATAKALAAQWKD